MNIDDKKKQIERTCDKCSTFMKLTSMPYFKSRVYVCPTCGNKTAFNRKLGCPECEEGKMIKLAEGTKYYQRGKIEKEFVYRCDLCSCIRITEQEL